VFALIGDESISVDDFLMQVHHCVKSLVKELHSRKTLLILDAKEVFDEQCAHKFALFIKDIIEGTGSAKPKF
jgi:hypothetical protein